MFQACKVLISVECNAVIYQEFTRINCLLKLLILRDNIAIIPLAPVKAYMDTVFKAKTNKNRTKFRIGS